MYLYKYKINLIKNQSLFLIKTLLKMIRNADEIKIKKESVRIWLGVGLAVFGCILIMAGLCIPPAGIIDGSVLTAVGEIFGLSGGCIGVFAMSRRDNAKIDYLYDAEIERRNNNNNTEEDEDNTGEDLQ